MLAGTTRVRLLRRIFAQPGLTVSQLAATTQIGISDASQELRRIQSRGLLQAERRGSFVFYRPAPDPQVPSAAPLLQALRISLTGWPPEQDGEIIRIATALAYARRITIAKVLRRGPQTTPQLEAAVRISRNALNRHLRILTASGFVHRNGGTLVFHTPTHPLARALARLLRK